MVIHLDPELESALKKSANQENIAPEMLAINILRKHFPASHAPIVPRDQWERRLLDIGTDCGVSLPHSALSSEELYD